MAQTYVKVKDISTDDTGRPTELYGTERILTYKAFLLKNDAYELIGQSDEDGNLIPGNPNLGPQHRPAQNLQNVGPVVNTGEMQAEIERLKAELSKAQGQQVTPPTPVQAEVREKRKRGPRPKEKQLTEQIA